MDGKHLRKQRGTRASSAEFARYDRRANTLELSGLPVVTWKGDEYRASRIFIDLDADTIRLEGTVRGQITTEAAAEPAAERPEASDRSAVPTDAANGDGAEGAPRG